MAPRHRHPKRGADAWDRHAEAKGNTRGGNLVLKSPSGSAKSDFGYQALHRNTAGKYITVIGNKALNTNTTGNSNSADGTFALAADFQ
jgi:hypothetical protein